MDTTIVSELILSHVDPGSGIVYDLAKISRKANSRGTRLYFELLPLPGGAPSELSNLAFAIAPFDQGLKWDPALHTFVEDIEIILNGVVDEGVS